ncbi:AAA family ATPase [Streptomyces albipurpureus]|uniref:Novel STAND NTPase 1 domain-containing protein n=1 Tax=Streptomyces albipurpureus TaxID=2897419 RepID=A0ABT0UIH4_9ACTN|nr:AAA family ATPase [Streptomyces sp. CWNU-1]MCM2388126.1 hypothetical protein [Streptomyces sp. CWNU-1]
MAPSEEEAGSPADPSVHQRAEASGEQSTINQAGRDLTQVGGDLHTHYYDRHREVHRTAPPDRTAVCPYPGLAPFSREQSEWFFGRERLTSRLLSEVNDRVGVGGPLFVVAPSGAGKSSLLRAGLLAALADGRLPAAGSADWQQILMTPTDRPAAALLRQLSALSDTPIRLNDASSVLQATREALSTHSGSPTGSTHRIVVVVDQLEEVFTLCTDEQQRREFLSLLAALAERGEEGQEPVALVICGLRADFYAQCLNYPSLRSALEHDQILVGPMTAEEIQDAILLPAAVQRLHVEPGLLELLLRDLDTSGRPHSGHHYDAGRLPLLAHALQATWQQRQGQALTVEGYNATGGIHRAVSTTADKVYHRLDNTGQQVARTLFLRLVRLGDGWEDTRRRVIRDDLILATSNETAARSVLDSFITARLLTQSTDTIEITHEALLRAWPMLRRWIDADRAGHLIRQEIEEASSLWHRDSRESALLYRGGRLARAQEWARSGQRGELSEKAAEFLTASVRHQRRASRTRQGLVAVLVVLTLIASVTALIAFRQTTAAQRERDIAVAHQITAVADRIRGEDSTLAARLDLTAHRIRPTEESYTRLMNDAVRPMYVPLPGSNRYPAISPDGKVLATETDGAIRLWDISNPLAPRGGQARIRMKGSVDEFAFSPDGDTLAVSSGHPTDTYGTGDAQLWDISDKDRPRPIGSPLTGYDAPIRSFAFSPDGRLLAGSTDDSTTRLWEVNGTATPKPLGDPLPGRGDVAFTKNSQTLFTDESTADGIGVWDVRDPSSPVRTSNIPPHSGDLISNFALSGDSSTIVASVRTDGNITPESQQARSVQLWDVSTPARPRKIGAAFEPHPGYPFALGLSTDGSMLVTGGDDQNRTLRLWSGNDLDLPSPIGEPLTGHSGSINSAQFTRDETILVTASENTSTGADSQQVFIWKMPRAVLPGHGSVRNLALSKDARTLATAGEHNIVQLWDLSSPSSPRRLGRLRGGARFSYELAFTPDGRTLATTVRTTTSDDDGRIQLWNISNRSQPRPWGPPLNDHSAPLTFSKDGKTLHAGTQDWDVSAPSRPVPVDMNEPKPKRPEGVRAEALSPDGELGVTFGEGHSVQIWKPNGSGKPRLVGTPLTGHTDRVTSAAFSTDRSLLATAGEDRAVRIWRLTRRGHATPLDGLLTGHTGYVGTLSFLSTTYLLSGSDDGTVRIWDLNTSRVIRTLCESTTDTVVRNRWKALFGETEYRAACS